KSACPGRTAALPMGSPCRRTCARCHAERASKAFGADAGRRRARLRWSLRLVWTAWLLASVGYPARPPEPIAGFLEISGLFYSLARNIYASFSPPEGNDSCFGAV